MPVSILNWVSSAELLQKTSYSDDLLLETDGCTNTFYKDYDYSQHHRVAFSGFVPGFSGTMPILIDWSAETSI